MSVTTGNSGNSIISTLKSNLSSLGLSLALLFCVSGISNAFEVSRTDEMTTHIDTTVSSGMAFRMSERDRNLIGRPNNGTNYTQANFDDGNLNYDKGDVVSANVKVTHELLIDSDDFRIFGRAFYFYDYAILDRDTEHVPLSKAAETESGKDLKLLDLYVDSDIEIAGRPVSFRLGNQVVNWGESLFTRNGLNSINPVDVAKFRIAGAEVRDALVPIPAIDVKFDINDNLSFEGFYSFGWQNTEIEPHGTFFSTNDFISPGSNIAHLTLADGYLRSDNGETGPDDCNSNFQPFQGLTVSQIAAGIIAQTPGIDPAAATQQAVSAAALAPVCANAPRTHDREAGDGGEFGVALRFFAPQLNYAEFGFYFARIHSRLPVLSAYSGDLDAVTCGRSGDVSSPQSAVASSPACTGNLAGSARYFREFPEDIGLYGMSVNSEIGSTGWSVQSELAYRNDQPIQVEDDETTAYSLSALERLGSPIYQVGGGLFSGRLGSKFGNAGPAGSGEYIPGYRRKDVLQAQIATTKSFGPWRRVDQSFLVLEAAFTNVIDMERKHELRYEAPKLKDRTDEEQGADSFSWGYRILGQSTINNAIGAMSLTPRIAFSHDVKGLSPAPIRNFREGRKVVTLSLLGNYQNAWTGALSWTNEFDHEYDESDRDFLAFSVSRTF